MTLVSNKNVGSSHLIYVIYQSVCFIKEYVLLLQSTYQLGAYEFCYHDVFVSSKSQLCQKQFELLITSLPLYVVLNVSTILWF